MRLWPQTRLWRILFSLALAFLVYSAGTYLGVPPLIRYVARNQGRILHRQITTGVVTFNPYKLRLIVDDVQMDGRDAAQPFIAIAQVNLRLSWSSLWRRALVVKQLAVERPSIHAVRLGPTTFDFSDLIPPVGRQNFAVCFGQRRAIHGFDLSFTLELPGGSARWAGRRSKAARDRFSTRRLVHLGGLSSGHEHLSSAADGAAN